MGCACAAASTVSQGSTRAHVDPEPKEVTLRDGTTTRIGLVSESLAYCLLAVHGDGALFIDSRPRAAFDKGHLHAAWCVDVHVASTSTNGNDEPSGGNAEAALEGALRARCSLRTVVICGELANIGKDEGVLNVLQLLQKVGVRPKGQLLVLRGGVSAFSRRFAFCIRRKGGEKTLPLPPCPAEVLAPDRGLRRPPAIYLGTHRCVHEPATDKVLAALGIRTIVNLSGKPCKPTKRDCRVLNVQAAVGDGENTAALGQDACEKVKRLTAPCLLYGPASALAVAMFFAETFPAVAQTVDEVDAFIRFRFPAAADLDASAHAALSKIIKRNWPNPREETVQPGAEMPPPSPAPDPPVPAPVASPPNAAPAATPRGNGVVPHSSDGPTYVEELCSKLQKKDRRGAAMNTVRVALTHILEQPSEPKFRRLKESNERVKREVLAHPEAVMLFRLAGFVNDGGDLVLPPAAPLQALRDIVAKLPPPKQR